MSTSRRKIEHLEHCAKRPVESRSVGPGFDDVMLVHRAMPQIDMDDIDMSVKLFGRDMKAPFLIASITGGHPETKPVNKALAEAAEITGVGIGVGSQRAAVEDPAQEDSFSIVREVAPNTFVYGNIGAAQLKEYDLESIELLVEMLEADAMAVHLNFLQEAIQPEGDRDATMVYEAIEEVCSLKVPIIVKETGAGICAEDAMLLKEAGVSAIDVGGVGGTSWSGVEVYRADETGDTTCKNLGELYWDFGIPTVSSILECRSYLPVIATGGVRTGLDIARSISLGANAASAALPFVAPALKGTEEVVKGISNMLNELRVAMFLCGSGTIEELRQGSTPVVTGWTKEYITQRGFDLQDLVKRSDISKDCFV